MKVDTDAIDLARVLRAHPELMDIMATVYLKPTALALPPSVLAAIRALPGSPTRGLQAANHPDSPIRV